MDKQAVNQNLSGTGMTVDQFLVVLSAALGGSKDTLEGAEFTLMEGGMTSKVICVRFSKINDEKNITPASVVVKIPCAQCLEIAFAMIGKVGSKAKCLQISSLLKKSEYGAYKVLEPVRSFVPLPKIIYNSENFLIMEDLAVRSGMCEDLEAGFTLGQWRSIVLHMARLHGWSTKSSVSFKSILPECHQVADLFGCYFYAEAQDNLTAIIKKYPQCYQPNIESIYKQEISSESFQQHIQMYRRVMPDVLLHGDLWIKNIFFKKNVDCQLTDDVAAIIDWQMASIGCGLLDIARVAAWAVTPDLRLEHEAEILELYRKEFCTSSGMCIAVDKMRQVYDHMLAIFFLKGVPSTDFLLNVVTGGSEAPASLARKAQFLSRLKAQHDYIVTYFQREQ